MSAPNASILPVKVSTRDKTKKMRSVLTFKKKFELIKKELSWELLCTEYQVNKIMLLDTTGAKSTISDNLSRSESDKTMCDRMGASRTKIQVLIMECESGGTTLTLKGTTSSPSISTLSQLNTINIHQLYHLNSYVPLIIIIFSFISVSELLILVCTIRVVRFFP